MDEPEVTPVAKSKKVSWIDVVDGILHLPLTLLFLLWLALAKVFNRQPKIAIAISVVFCVLIGVVTVAEFVDALWWGR